MDVASGLLYFVAGVIATGAISYLFHRLSMIGPRLAYRASGLRLIGKERQELPQEVQIAFRGTPVERLAKTSIVLWNSGKQTIHGSDVVQDESIRFRFFNGAEVLDAAIIKRSKHSNRFTVEVDPRNKNDVRCDFDYLDPEDGVLMEMLHTGMESYPSAHGTIRGVPRGIEYAGEWPARVIIAGWELTAAFLAGAAMAAGATRLAIDLGIELETSLMFFALFLGFSTFVGAAWIRIRFALISSQLPQALRTEDRRETPPGGLADR